MSKEHDDTEIEITPEMIEVGSDAIMRFLGGLELSYPSEVVAAEVFRAMAEFTQKRRS